MKWQKYLKFVSVLTVIVGGLKVLFAASVLAAALNAEVLAQAGMSFASAAAGAAALTVSSGIDIAAGILGLRAAKDETKIKPAYIFGWICLIYVLFNQVYNLCVSMSPMNIAAFFSALILPVLYMIFAFKVRQGGNLSERDDS